MFVIVPTEEKTKNNLNENGENAMKVHQWQITNQKAKDKYFKETPKEEELKME